MRTSNKCRNERKQNRLALGNEGASAGAGEREQKGDPVTLFCFVFF